MSGTFIIKIREDEPEKLQNIVNTLNFGVQYLPKGSKDKTVFRSILAKIEHAREFPTMGYYEVFITPKEARIFKELNSVVNEQVPVLELK